MFSIERIPKYFALPDFSEDKWQRVVTLKDGRKLGFSIHGCDIATSGVKVVLLFPGLPGGRLFFPPTGESAVVVCFYCA